MNFRRDQRGLLAHVEVRLFFPLQHAVLLQTAALLGVLLLGFGYFWLLVPSIEVRLQQLGLFCSIFTISMYLSPLTDLVSGVSVEVGEIRRIGSHRQRL